MLKSLGAILGISILPLIVVVLGIYGYKTNKMGLALHYMFLFLGLMFLKSGIREFRLNKKRSYIHFFVVLLSFVDFFFLTN
ncbi:DUF3953 domain-containing protein [Gottfriedia acidiceleris]|uniref:DUF3953 domain-containing protein n=1 Tax=Gottfriedia acidiceleris TaxID=371036 RepID=A0ABY4JMG7_9BACI|nr:DUF3953 domain-containing protein [Gottfriedia acidiceleris]UPM55032.1 DUF3953 domain-containing protein [Gottfriedia acidiceleris]